MGSISHFLGVAIVTQEKAKTREKNHECRVTIRFSFVTAYGVCHFKSRLAAGIRFSAPIFFGFQRSENVYALALMGGAKKNYSAAPSPGEFRELSLSEFQLLSLSLSF
ncbi:MAG: hypothetical protein WCW30_00700 [Candidatus Gracilibacteria bacterium]